MRYCLNNPLKFSDPDGEIFIPILVGAAISVITNGVDNIINDRAFFYGAGKAALMGGIGGGFSFGIGQLATGMSGFGKLAFQTLTHGHLGGLMSGNSYGSGFLAGAFGSLAATGTYGLLQNASKGVQGIGMIASGAISGGIGAEIGGGEFWDGFRSGFISSAFNHVMHRPDDPPRDTEASSGVGVDWGGVTNTSILLAGGVAEMTVGGVVSFFSAGTSTPFTVPLILDGAGRTVANAQRLFMYFRGKNSVANAYPTSIGGAIGKIGDMINGVPFDQVGNVQAISGTVNDISAFLVTGGSGFALRNAIMYPSFGTSANYIFTFTSYNYSLYDNVKNVTTLKP